MGAPRWLWLARGDGLSVLALMTGARLVSRACSSARRRRTVAQQLAARSARATGQQLQTLYQVAEQRSSQGLGRLPLRRRGGRALGA